MGNNPVVTIDPDGELAMIPFLLIAASLSYNTYRSAEAGATGWQWAGTNAVTIASSAVGPGIIPGAIAGGANAAIMDGNIGRGALFGGISGGISSAVNVSGVLPGALVGGITDGLVGGLETALYDGNFGTGFRRGLIFGSIQGGIYGGLRAANDPFGRNLAFGNLTEQGRLNYVAHLAKNAMPSPQFYASNGGGEPTYSYNGKEGLTYYQLYTEILINQAAIQFGIKDIAALAAAVTGAPLLPTRAKFKDATRGTSVASKYLSKIPGQLPFSVPTVTGYPRILGGRGTRVMLTRVIGRIAGRAIPIVGWGILSYDVGMTLYNTQIEFNKITGQ